MILDAMSDAKRGPYRNGVETRARAVDAAVRLFSQNGYRATSMREIAAEVGATHTGLKHHFASKEALLTAVLEYRDEIDDAVFADDIAGGDDRLTAILHLARRNAERRALIELFTTLAAEATDPTHPAHAYFDARYRRVTASLDDMFVRLRDEGRLRPGVRPDWAARTLVAIMDGLQVQFLYRTAAPGDTDGAAPASGDMLSDLRDFLLLVLADGDAAR